MSGRRERRRRVGNCMVALAVTQYLEGREVGMLDKLGILGDYIDAKIYVSGAMIPRP